MANYNMYNATHKTWDHVGNVTPLVEYCEGKRPHGDFQVASWLPVSRLDKRYEHYFVVSAGKVVAFDRTERLVPAGLKTAFAASSGDVLEYTATDVTEGVIDLSTGVTVAAAAGYTGAELDAALLARGLIDAGEACEDFISQAVGVAPYNFLKHPGGDGLNPAEYLQHNYNPQHRIALLCKYVVEMPLVPALQTACDLSSSEAISDTEIADWDEDDADGAWFSSTSLALSTRYENEISDGDDVVCLLLPVLNLAKNTTLTPITLVTGFTREVDSIGELAQAGDYFIDYEVGAILMFEEGGDAAAVSTGSITFYAYDSVPTTLSSYACAVGNLRPGDFVRADANSNFTKARVFASTDDWMTTDTSPTEAELATFANAIMGAQNEIIGQVLDSSVWPRSALDMVRTAYPQLGTLDQMPGSASGGLSDQITYAGGANKTIRILLLR